MRRKAFLLLLLAATLTACAGEPLTNGSIVTMRSLPAGVQLFDVMRFEPSPDVAMLAGTNAQERAALQAQRDSIAGAWVQRLRETNYAVLDLHVERADVFDAGPVLRGARGPRVFDHTAARAQIYMGPKCVWTAAWIETPDGQFDAEHPQMKYIFDGQRVRERAWNAEHGWYETTYSKPWHPFGSDDFKALDADHACMVGSSTQTWLGDSPTADYYERRLAECTLLPGTTVFHGQPCHVIRWYAPDGPEYSMTFDFYFNDDDVLIGRDARTRNVESKRTYRIIERSVCDWTFADAPPAALASFQWWLRLGPEDPATKAPPDAGAPAAQADAR